MGNNCGGPSLSSASIAATKNEVDLMLERAQEEEKLNFKVLLLGTHTSAQIIHIGTNVLQRLIWYIRRRGKWKIDGSEADKAYLESWWWID